MSRLNDLTSLHRKLQVAREITDALVLEVLELCSPTPIDKIPGKYVLTKLCLDGFWLEASIWVLKRSAPTWTLTLILPDEGHKTAKLLDPKNPIWVFVGSNPQPARAVLEALVQGKLFFEREKLGET